MKKIIIKASGKILNNKIAFEQLLQDMHQLIAQGYACVLIHGGGIVLSNYCKESEIEPLFDKDGRRITSYEEMLAADMILTGSINTNIIRMCTALGINAVGLHCADMGLVIGEAIDDTYTGIVSAVDTTILALLTQQNILPIVSPVSTTKHGKALNINADDVAKHIAIAWKVDTLLFLTDTGGVIINEEVVSNFECSTLQRYIDTNIIKDGMALKITSAIDTLKQGIPSIIIGTFQKTGDLEILMNNEMGTNIIL